MVNNPKLLPPQERLSDVGVLTTKTGCYPSSWSSDGNLLAFWNDKKGGPICSQAYVLDLNNPDHDKGDVVRISPGYGRALDPEFLPGDSMLMYTTTHQYEIKECEGDTIKPFFARMRSMNSIFTSSVRGEMGQQIKGSNAVDAQARISPTGKVMVFTSNRTVSYGIWRSNPDGSNPIPLIDGFYFAGEPRFSPNGEHVVFRARKNAPKPNKIAETSDLDLRETELYMCKIDGTELVRLTDFGAAVANPCFHPDGKHIFFSSNHHRSDGKRNLFVLNIVNNTVQQITSGDADETHPIVHPDGNRLAYSALFNDDREVFLANISMN
ncbi:MAG: hypothetical protein LAT54_08840 [Cryomorphaceae bacterium]|nr:hypothetical protein [Cryomorphaceae bacterium]